MLEDEQICQSLTVFLFVQSCSHQTIRLVFLSIIFHPNTFQTLRPVSYPEPHEKIDHFRRHCKHLNIGIQEQRRKLFYKCIDRLLIYIGRFTRNAFKSNIVSFTPLLKTPIRSTKFLIAKFLCNFLRFLFYKPSRYGNSSISSTYKPLKTCLVDV